MQRRWVGILIHEVLIDRQDHLLDLNAHVTLFYNRCLPSDVDLRAFRTVFEKVYAEKLSWAQHVGIKSSRPVMLRLMSDITTDAESDSQVVEMKVTSCVSHHFFWPLRQSILARVPAPLQDSWRNTLHPSIEDARILLVPWKWPSAA